jgi:hypothetical protein
MPKVAAQARPKLEQDILLRDTPLADPAPEGAGAAYCAIEFLHELSRAGVIERSGMAIWKSFEYPKAYTVTIVKRPLGSLSPKGQLVWLGAPEEPRTLLYKPFIEAISEDFFASSARWMAAAYVADPGLFPRGIATAFTVTIWRGGDRLKIDLPAMVTIRARTADTYASFLETWACRLDYGDAGGASPNRPGARWAAEHQVLRDLTPDVRTFFDGASAQFGALLGRHLDLVDPV